MVRLKKLPSSTVLEAMMALLLVTIIVGIATVVFARLANSGKTPAFIRAQEAIESMTGEEITVGGLTVRKESMPVENTTSVHVRFTITDSTGKLLYTHDRIVLP